MFPIQMFYSSISGIGYRKKHHRLSETPSQDEKQLRFIPFFINIYHYNFRGALTKDGREIQADCRQWQRCLSSDKSQRASDSEDRRGPQSAKWKDTGCLKIRAFRWPLYLKCKLDSSFKSFKTILQAATKEQRIKRADEQNANRFETKKWQELTGRLFVTWSNSRFRALQISFDKDNRQLWSCYYYI